MKEKFTKLIIPSREEVQKIMKIPGKIKGAPFKGDLEYILIKKGREGLKAVEKETERLGYPIKYEAINETEWYPVGLRMISLWAILATFNWRDKELAELAEVAPKVSFIVRFFMKYFISSEKLFKVATPRMWERYYSVGSLKPFYFRNDQKGGVAVMQLKNFKLHPLHCFFLAHFFIGVFKLSKPRPLKKITFKETKCVFKNDPYHEYLIEWTY